jgi:dTDP-4-amino-4,6-dideoxygalactose transaminase
MIEDACQAHAALWHGRPIGSFGTGCFSFYPTKNVTAGEGGVITTHDAELAARARLLRSHGMPRRYYHESLGYNFRLSDIHAAIGLAQMDHLDEWTERRIANATLLAGLLADLPIGCQATFADVRHVYHQFTVRIPEGRDDVAAYLRQREIGHEIYYPTPIHQQPLYRDLGYTDVLPATEQAAREVLSLPIHPSITAADLHVVADAVHAALATVMLERVAAD